ncbi:MAG: hypothetical protein V1765_03300 [bacterium]
MPEFNTPILFLIFNRPETTKKVLEQIKLVKPRQLFIAADGPRINNSDDIEKCSATRAIVNKIDWPCQVQTLFRSENLGCRLAVSTAIDWFFSQVEEGIILEDDCLPQIDFFKFCELMLNKYRDQPRVMHISGDNFLLQSLSGSISYFVSRIPNIWGWATWRRAWQLYDGQLRTWQNFLDQEKIKNIFKSKIQQVVWLEVLSKSACGQENSWDWQWTYAVFDHDGLCLNPAVNLVSNIGFDKTALHTRQTNHPWKALPVNSLNWPLAEPKNLAINADYDSYITKTVLGATFKYYGKKILKACGLFDLVKSMIKL